LDYSHSCDGDEILHEVLRKDYQQIYSRCRYAGYYNQVLTNMRVVLVFVRNFRLDGESGGPTRSILNLANVLGKIGLRSIFP